MKMEKFEDEIVVISPLPIGSLARDWGQGLRKAGLEKGCWLDPLQLKGGVVDPTKKDKFCLKKMPKS